MARTCPDCGHEMEPIQILDRTRTGGGPGVRTHVGLAWTTPDAPVDPTTRSIAAEGVVEAHRCGACDRIVLVGRAMASED